jgi:hypothetical protein
MRRWKLLVVLVVLLLLAVVVLGRLVLPRFFSEDSTSAWTYRSPQHGFSMTLPSGDWKEIKKKDCDVAFYHRKHSTLVGVDVTRGDRDAFLKAVKQMKDYTEATREELLSDPRFAEGETESGNPFVYLTVHAKADRNDAVFVARSLIWCKDQTLLVSVRMEGPLTMQSKTGKGAEEDFYDNAVRTICLSVH